MIINIKNKEILIRLWPSTSHRFLHTKRIFLFINQDANSLIKSSKNIRNKKRPTFVPVVSHDKPYQRNFLTKIVKTQFLWEEVPVRDTRSNPKLSVHHPKSLSTGKNRKSLAN